MMNTPVTPAPAEIAVTGGKLDSAVLCVSGMVNLIVRTVILWIFKQTLNFRRK